MLCGAVIGAVLFNEPLVLGVFVQCVSVGVGSTDFFYCPCIISRNQYAVQVVLLALRECLRKYRTFQQSVQLVHASTY